MRCVRAVVVASALAAASAGAAAGADLDAAASVPHAGEDHEDEAASLQQVMLLQQMLLRQRGPAGPSSAAASSGSSSAPASSLASASVSAFEASSLSETERLWRRPPSPSPSPSKEPHAGQAFVHLFEWSWDDIAKECEDFLGPKGFTAVQISPPNEHVTGDGWFTRYQPVSYNLTSRSGNETQFISMVRRCRAAGVGIYADAVINHCAPQGGVGVGGSVFSHRTYPLFEPNDFHHSPGDSSTNCGVNNYQDAYNVQYCDLEGMPDLCTACSRVQERVAAYINRLGEIGVSGFRVDAAKHMEPVELGQLLSKVNSSLFRFQEVFASPGEAVQTPPYLKNGAVTEFGFSATVGAKFKGSGLLRNDLATIGTDWGLLPSDHAVVFIDDHDTQRSGAAPLTFKSGKAYDAAVIFMLAYPYGYPKVMSSYYFDSTDQGPPPLPVHAQDGSLRCGPGQPWVCEHRRPDIANMVAWRRVAADAALNGFVSTGDRLAFCRGRAACVAVNMDQSEPWSLSLSTMLPEGEYCDVIRSDGHDCPKVTVDSDGKASIRVPPLGAVAFHVDGRIVSSSSSSDLEDSLPLE